MVSLRLLQKVRRQKVWRSWDQCPIRLEAGSQTLNKPLTDLRLIVMHLGAGSSVTAVNKENHSILRWDLRPGWPDDEYTEWAN